MRLPDVNILVYAFDDDAVAHQRYRDWLTQAISSDEPLALSFTVLSGFVRVVTHPKVLRLPASHSEAFGFARTLLHDPRTALVGPGADHWRIFERLCAGANARGNLITDAHIAALAIESGCELITADRGFARFPELRWSHPLSQPT